MPLNAASCWYFFFCSTVDTHFYTSAPRRCHSVGRVVQNGMQTGGAVSDGEADSAPAAAAAGRRDGG